MKDFITFFQKSEKNAEAALRKKHWFPVGTIFAPLNCIEEELFLVAEYYIKACDNIYFYNLMDGYFLTEREAKTITSSLLMVYSIKIGLEMGINRYTLYFRNIKDGEFYRFSYLEDEENLRESCWVPVYKIDSSEAEIDSQSTTLGKDGYIKLRRPYLIDNLLAIESK